MERKAAGLKKRQPGCLGHGNPAFLLWLILSLLKKIKM